MALATAADVHLVPLVKSELRHAATELPVFFVKDIETGRFYPAALFGLTRNENLFWNGEGFDCEYVPLNVRRQPFYVGGEDAVGGVMCIDLDSPAISSAGDQAISAADGGDSAYIKSIHAILGELVRQQAETVAFVDCALAAKVVVPIKLDIVLLNGEQVTVDGLYGVDERALERVVGGMDSFDTQVALIAMMLSLDHVAKLVRLKNARAAAADAWLGREL